MYKDQIEDYANYEIYENDGGKCETICVCNKYEFAELLTKLLASSRKDNGTVYYTGITRCGDFVPGGGWYVSYHKNEEGNLVRNELS